MYRKSVYVTRSQEVQDAIVVGSGISGGFAAKELTEGGLNVLLLERGHDLTGEHRIHQIMKVSLATYRWPTSLGMVFRITRNGCPAWSEYAARACTANRMSLRIADKREIARIKPRFTGNPGNDAQIIPECPNAA